MFITFEGTEGSGKTSQAVRLYNFLQQQGLPALITREPGGTTMGERLREVVLSARAEPINTSTELLIFCAARAHLVETVIRPALASGRIVVCDRFADSTRAYQGYAGGLDLSVVETVITLATGGLQPDLTILVDLPVELGLTRRRGSGEVNRIDRQALTYHEQVRQGFLQIAARFPERIIVVDGQLTMDELEVQIRREACRRLAINYEVVIR